MSKFCRNCGSPLTLDTKFCSTCGAIIQRTQTLPAAAAANQPNGKNTSRLKKLLIQGIAFLTVAIVLAIVIPRLMAAIKDKNSVTIESVDGQPYTGRAITISGEGFGYYDPQNSRVTIDGKDTPIVSWG